MTLAFDFHPEAEAEFAADADWHDAREAGVGDVAWLGGRSWPPRFVGTIKDGHADGSTALERGEVS